MTDQIAAGEYLSIDPIARETITVFSDYENVSVIHGRLIVRYQHIKLYFEWGQKPKLLNLGAYVNWRLSINCKFGASIAPFSWAPIASSQSSNLLNPIDMVEYIT